MDVSKTAWLETISQLKAPFAASVETLSDMADIMTTIETQLITEPLKEFITTFRGFTSKIFCGTLVQGMEIFIQHVSSIC